MKRLFRTQNVMVSKGRLAAIFISAFCIIALVSCLCVAINFASSNTGTAFAEEDQGIIAQDSTQNTTQNSATQASLTVPDYPGGTVKSTDEISNGYKQITLTNTTKDNFEAYRKSLEDDGYHLHAENNINDNLFATYLKESAMVHYYYVAYSGEARIIYSENTLVPSNEAPEYIKSYEESVSLVKIPYGLDDALGCIYRLCDGSFIVIDGGRTDEVYKTNSMTTEFMNLISSLAPDPNNIVIRAWYISHPHIDHYGVLKEICKEINLGATTHPEYKNLHVESFLYNFVSTTEACAHLGTLGDKMDELQKQIKKAYPDATYYKGLTGQVYKFPGVELEILNSMCDVVPNVIGTEAYDVENCDRDKAEAAAGRGDGNLETMVVRIKSLNTGKVFLVTADASKKNNQEMVNRYGSALKADYMTINHHGHDEDRYRARNGNIDLYKYADPDVVFFPATVERYEMQKVPTRDVWYVDGPNKYVSYTATGYICDQCKNNCYVAGQDSYTIPVKADPQLLDDLTISFRDASQIAPTGSAATGDWFLFVGIGFAAAAVIFVCFAKRKKLKSMVVVCASSCLVVIFAAGVAFAGVGFSQGIEAQILDDDSVVFSQTKLANTHGNDVEVSSTTLTDTGNSGASWKIIAGDTVIYDGLAGNAYSTSLRIPAGESVDVSISSNITGDSARMLCSTGGLKLSFKYDKMAWVSIYNVDGTRAHDDIYVVPGQKINFPTNVTSPKGSAGWEFEGWYDTEGKKIESVSCATSAIAHYKEPEVKLIDQSTYSVFSCHNRQGQKSKAQQGFVISDATENEDAKIFQAEDGGHIYVYDFDESGETAQSPKATFDLGSTQDDNHSNNLEWGKETPDGCSYPAMYVSVGKPGADIDLTCFVEGITKKADGKYTSKTVQKISIPSNHRDKWRMAGYVPIFGAPSWLVDREGGYLWIFSAYQRTTPAITTGNWQNEYIATKFKLPKLTEGTEKEGVMNVTLSADDIVDQIIFPYETCFTQSGTIKNDKIYYCYGLGSDTTRPSRIRVFDTKTKTISAGYNLEVKIPYEPEDIVIKDGSIYMNTNIKDEVGPSRIYKINMPSE